MATPGAVTAGGSAVAAAMMLAVSLSGCAARPESAGGTETARAASSDAAWPLPAGEGRGILERDCTACHDLAGLWAYRGYYNEQRWRAMIVTMIDHGAELDEAEIETLTSYLVEHFGPGTRE